tara:strand:+ start:538 stop:1197 length:660 start_codon:yes stop_codon:yes gene_type:complete
MNEKIFIACDSRSLKKVKEIIKETKTKKLKIGYKFGLEFLNSKNGRSFIGKLKNKIVFADLKLHDIPNTCSSAIKAIKDLRVNYLTIHIGSGLEALKAAKKVSGKIKLVGVTTLTSLDNKNLKEIGYNKSVKNLIIHQSKLAQRAKLDAIVCSPHEVKYVRKFFKKEIITPGVRFDKNKQDQKRTMHPSKIKSDWLVCGRIITKGKIKNNLKKLIQYLN